MLFLHFQSAQKTEGGVPPSDKVSLHTRKLACRGLYEHMQINPVHPVIETYIYILYVHIDKVGPLSVNTHISCCVNDTELTHALVSSIRCSTGPSEEDGKTLGEIKEKIKTRPNAFFEMEAFLPKKNG